MASAQARELSLPIAEFRYSGDQWAPIEEALNAAGIEPAGARPIIEEAASLWMIGFTKQEARQEARSVRGQIERFKRASADIELLLPASARASLARMIATLERTAQEDDEAAMSWARPKTLGEELCHTWRYQLGGEIKGSWNTLSGEAGGPLVRFLVSATAPIKGEALSASQAFDRIKECKKKISAGVWR